MAVRFPFRNTQQHVDWLAGDYLMRIMACFLKVGDAANDAKAEANETIRMDIMLSPFIYMAQ